MAASNPELRRVGRVAAGALLAVVSAASAAAVRNSELPINVEAASTDFDYKNNSLVFKRVRITQGDMQVDAEEARATGLNFDNSEWQLTGDVRILVPDGTLSSSSATVTFRNNEILRAVIVGKPASFEQKLRQSQQVARGRAGTITYDVKASTVRLNGDAWLTDGQNQIEGATLIYNIGQQRVAANPDATTPGGVKITINPRTSEITTTPPTTTAPEPSTKDPQPPRQDPAP
jgi:lipopolysaccharide transport protein LptA